MRGIIHFTGPENSGKSTNAKLLINYCRRKRVCISFIRFPSTAEVRSIYAYPTYITSFFMKMGRIECRRDGASRCTVDTSFIKRNYLLWMLLEVFHFFYSYIINFVPLLIVNCYIITTRFLVDFLTDLVLLTWKIKHNLHFVSIIIYSFLVAAKLIPLKYVIYLDVSNEELFERYKYKRRTYNRPFWEPNLARSISLIIYNYMGKVNNGIKTIYIDTTGRSLSNVFIELMRSISICRPWQE